MIRRTLVFIVSIAFAAACDRTASPAAKSQSDSTAVRTTDSIARARQDSINRASPGYVIDSLLPIEEEIRRFRASIGGTVRTEFVHASPTRDSLYARFVRAVEGRDTSALRDMHISAREFIDLIYPESPYTRPPYRQAPRIRWGFMELSSSQGLDRLLARRGGKPLGALGVECPTAAAHQGQNTIWNDCVVRVRGADGGETRERLFGGIVERAGRFKFVSYANQY